MEEVFLTFDTLNRNLAILTRLFDLRSLVSSAYILPFRTGIIRSNRHFGQHHQDKAISRRKIKSLERYRKSESVLQDTKHNFRVKKVGMMMCISPKEFINS